MERLYHVVNALLPLPNAFGGTVTTAVINMKNWNHVSFVVQCGTGAVGTARITVEACDNTTPSNPVAIPFYYQECIASDVFGPIIKTADVTGFLTSAANNKVYKVEVDGSMISSVGYGYVRLKSIEQTVGVINGSVVAILTEGRFASEVPDTVLI
jgi:hypothetical protein